MHELSSVGATDYGAGCTKLDEFARRSASEPAGSIRAAGPRPRFFCRNAPLSRPLTDFMTTTWRLILCFAVFAITGRAWRRWPSPAGALAAPPRPIRAGVRSGAAPPSRWTGVDAHSRSARSHPEVGIAGDRLRLRFGTARLRREARELLTACWGCTRRLIVPSVAVMSAILAAFTSTRAAPWAASLGPR